MFHHVKELQFNARVSKPDPRFANLLLEQFGGENGELAAAMQYFTQAFAAKQPYPDKYDMLMDIATEEFSHLEIVGATIQMLLKGVNGELKDAADQSEIMEVLNGKAAKENVIHQALVNPQFGVLSAGGPRHRQKDGHHCHEQAPTHAPVACPETNRTCNGKAHHWASASNGPAGSLAEFTTFASGLSAQA